MLNVDGISIYTRTYVTADSDQIGQIYLGEEELKVRRIGHDAMMEQDAVHEAEGSADLRSIRKGLGISGKTDPASSTRSDKRGSTTATVDCWVSLTSFVSLLVQKIR